MRIAVLALQGAFREHLDILQRLDVEVAEIRQARDFDQEFDGVVIPGGESTVMAKLLMDLELYEPLKSKISDGLPAFGTCAGLILLASKLSPDSNQRVLKAMDTTAVRNAYGRQLGSFSTHGDFNQQKVPMVFIRAPYISEYSEDVEVLSRVDGKVVAARQGNVLATAFHPELTDDLTVHQYFLSLVTQ